MDGSVRFEVDEPSPFPADPLTAVYLGQPVLVVPPNEGEDMTNEYMRVLSSFDSPLGRRVAVDVSGRSFTVQNHRWLRAGAVEQDALRSYFYGLQGRRGLTWIPTFADDFDMAALSSGPTSTSLVVRRCGFTYFGGPRFNRQHIRIELRNGTSLYRRIVSSSQGATTETLVLDSQHGVTLGLVEAAALHQLVEFGQQVVTLAAFRQLEVRLHVQRPNRPLQTVKQLLLHRRSSVV
jgi:hypothetical protein